VADEMAPIILLDIDRAIRILAEAVVFMADAQDTLLFTQQQLATVRGDIALVLLSGLGIAGRCAQQVGLFFLAEGTVGEPLFQGGIFGKDIAQQGGTGEDNGQADPAGGTCQEAQDAD
jgi:hypothetical protein